MPRRPASPAWSCLLLAWVCRPGSVGLRRSAARCASYSDRPTPAGAAAVAPAGKLVVARADVLMADGVRTYDRVLLGGQSRALALAARPVPALGRGHRERAARGRGHPGQQPPVVLRPLLRAAAAAAQGGIPGQVRIFHRPRAQGPGQPGVL